MARSWNGRQTGLDARATERGNAAELEVNHPDDVVVGATEALADLG